MSNKEPENNLGLGHCPECGRLLEAYISALRVTRQVLEAKERVGRAGIIDDVNFLGTDTALDHTLAEQKRAREAYARHRRARHGPAAG
jgi:hypothetical protein